MADVEDFLLPNQVPVSAELLHTLLDVALTGFILFRPLYSGEHASGEIVDLAYEYLNPAAQQMLQLPPQPAGSFLTLYPHAAETGVFAFYRDAFLSEQKTRHQINLQLDSLDGYFHLAAKRQGERLVVSFTDSNNQPRSAVEQTLRASQAKERAARAEAERERSQFQALLEQAPVGIGSLEGPELRITAANPLICAMWGRTQAEALGRPLLVALPELQDQGFAELLHQVRETQIPFIGTETPAQMLRHGVLTTSYYNFVYQPLYDTHGTAVGVLNVAVEVTEQVVARQQLEAKERQTNQLNEELSAANEELLAINTELFDTQSILHQLNEDLEARVVERTQVLQQTQQLVSQQKQHLERLFMQAPAAICILEGPDLVYALVNPGYQQLFPGRALLGKPILTALPELADQPVWHSLRQVYDTGKTHQALGILIPVAPYEGAALQDFYFNYIQQARYDAHGQIDGVLVFAFDVTEQVRAQQASEASAQQLRLLTDALPVLISYIDHEQRYQFANEAYRAWFNQDPAELLGQPVREVLGEQAYQATYSYMTRALAGERLAFDAQMPYRNDFIRHVHTDYLPDVRHGKVVGFYALITDITEQTLARERVQNLNEELAAINEELQATNEELGETNQQLTRTNVDLDNFIYTASHDLKQPIANIEGLLLALQHELPRASQVGQVPTMLHLMQHAIERFSRTIGHLTDVSRLQKAYAQPAAHINLERVIQEVQLDLAPLIAQTAAEVVITVPKETTLLFSEKNLRSVVYNLLSNALKYNHPDRPPIVHITYRPEAQFQVLEVQDNGLGIDLTRNQQKLFAMFQRLHTHVEGSGIGLYMVKKMIENAGGDIEVASTLGKGTTFTVYFSW
jgi:PAS domain S-box-containing protein